MAKASRSSSSKKCTCNPGWLIVALVLLTLGLYGVVGGFVAQFSGATASMVLPWYFVGILLIVLGKMAKWKSHGMCSAHGMK